MSRGAPAPPLNAPEFRTSAGASFAGAVELESVSLQGKGRLILDGISIRIGAGTVACLLGPSGCGKTSLLRLVAGVATPSSGRILIDEVEMAGPKRFVPPEKRNVGLVFQDFALFPHMTALQNVAYGLTALSRNEAYAAARRGLARVGMETMADRYPSSLSGGEQQRVALARAISPRPRVILLDEPFSGLDQRLRDMVRAETLAIVRETQATAVLVTHDPDEAIDVADHIFLMRDGRIVREGPPRAVYEKPVDAEAAKFFCSYNVFQAEVQDGAVQTPLGRFAAPGFSAGTMADVLVKPHALEVSQMGKGVPGFVKHIRFLGESQRLTLLVRGRDEPIQAVLPAGTQVTPLSEVKLSVRADGVYVFTSGSRRPT